MILDDGICTVYHKRNTALTGAKPVFTGQAFWWSWYGILSFETAPARPTPNREEVRTDLRVRILQNRGIANHDRVELQDEEGFLTAYEVVRAYHGTDEESGERITDLSLEVVTP